MHLCLGNAANINQTAARHDYQQTRMEINFLKRLLHIPHFERSDRYVLQWQGANRILHQNPEL